MTKVNSKGGMKNHVHSFDYQSVIGRSDGPVIDLENFDQFQMLPTRQQTQMIELMVCLNDNRGKLEIGMDLYQYGFMEVLADPH